MPENLVYLLRPLLTSACVEISMLRSFQLLAFLALPPRLHEPVSLRSLSSHYIGEQQICRFMNDHLQFMAAAEQILSGWFVSFRRERDPVGAAAEGINAACLEVDG